MVTRNGLRVVVATTLISGLAFVSVQTVALISGLAFITVLAVGIGSDTLFEFLYLEFQFVVHFVSPPLGFRSDKISVRGSPRYEWRNDGVGDSHTESGAGGYFAAGAFVPWIVRVV